MKYILYAFLICVIGPRMARGQNISVQDTNRVLQLCDQAGYYQFFNSDTALLLTFEAEALAQRLVFKMGEARAISRQAEVRHLRGEFPQALEAVLTAIQLSRKYKYPEVEAESLTFAGTIYFDLGDYNQSLTYLFQAKKIYDIIAHQLLGAAQQFPPFVLKNIGSVYEKLNRIDSALYYQKLALNYPIDIGPQLQADILVAIGEIERRQKDFGKALNTFRQVLQISELANDLLNKGSAQYQMAAVFREQNNFDSSIHYGRLGLLTAQKSSQKTVLLDVSSLLAQVYKITVQLDSAYYYQQIAMNLKDSLFGPDKFHKLQLLTLSEQQRVQQLKEDQALSKTRTQQTILALSIAVFLLITLIFWHTNKQQKKANFFLNEKNLQIEEQRDNLENTLNKLESTQAQLIQSEKMASLGELTAGIAHEIQNPLNFVNNFSDVNKEMLEELKAERLKPNAERDESLEASIINDVINNEEKINHHGKRADAIVKGMLQHSRTDTGQKEPTDINALADEYLRLAYQGQRAKDKSFNVKIITNFDLTLKKINIMPQDIGRVLLNLYNNAFYACAERSRSAVNEKNASTSSARQSYETFESTVTVTTKRLGEKVEIMVQDNGPGIPQNIIDKIFQPFFTTKPTGQGTGLGLSLSYDIIKAHGGELRVETKAGAGAEFIIQLPA